MEQLRMILLIVFTTLLVLVYNTKGQTPKRWLTQCAPTSVIPGSETVYNANVASALSDLTTAAGLELWGMAAYGQDNPASFAQAIFYCRGEGSGVTLPICQACVADAKIQFGACSATSTEAIIWYNECVVHVANRELSGVLMIQPQFMLWDLASFKADHSLKGEEQRALVLQVIELASLRKDGFSTASQTISPTVLHFVSVQCSPNLTQNGPELCSTCLSAIWEFVHSNELKAPADTPAIAGLTPSCQILTGYAPIGSSTFPGITQPSN